MIDRRRSVKFLAVLAASSVLFIACGDDSGGEALTEDELVAQYSEICVRISDEISALDADSIEEAQEAAREAKTIVERGIDDLEGLTPPDDIADDVNTGTESLALTGEVFGRLSEVESEDEFIEIGAEIDEARGQAEAVLSPLGITCESSEEADSQDATEPATDPEE